MEASPAPTGTRRFTSPRGRAHGSHCYSTCDQDLSVGPFATRKQAIEAICEKISNVVPYDPPPLPPDKEEALGIVTTIIGFQPEAAAHTLAEDYPHVSKDVLLQN